MWRSLKRFLFGHPLPSALAGHERLPLFLALAILSSDALSSVAYGPEEILLVLSQAGPVALVLTPLIALAIAGLIWIVIISYRQLLNAYPQGGGAYTVAKENLGPFAGLVAGAALLIDYVLTVAVSISAGIDAIYSAWTDLPINQTEFSLIILFVMVLINLRGVRESGWVFGLPTYFFIGAVFLTLGMGLWRSLSGAPLPPPASLSSTHSSLGWFLILKAFSSGAVTLTGIEAISNAVSIFRPPEHQNASRSLFYLGVLLSVMSLGVAFLSQHLGLYPDPQKSETLLSQLGHWALGNGVIYYILQLSTFVVLFLAANASFSAFPQLAALMAIDGYLPRQLRNRGDRLVFSNGIIGIGVLAGLLIYRSGASTQYLIPLYAIGVFIAFTLSQWGVARHHLRERKISWSRRAGIGLLMVGGAITAIVALIFAITKFTEGAWIVLVLIPVILWIFHVIHAHYASVAHALSLEGRQGSLRTRSSVVVIPVNAVHRGTLRALDYALSLSSEVHAVYIELHPDETSRLLSQWKRWCPGIELKIVHNPYRSFLQAFEQYLNELKAEKPKSTITVILPEFVPARPWQQLLHNQSALMLKLYLYGREDVILINVPYHLKE
ncbi:APC family permease [Candidatus Acetothermia bacterium]|nr:APC family permease [Candidatus Acetothermia bacterium]